MQNGAQRPGSGGGSERQQGHQFGREGGSELGVRSPGTFRQCAETRLETAAPGAAAHAQFARLVFQSALNGQQVALDLALEGEFGGLVDQHQQRYRESGCRYERPDRRECDQRRWKRDYCERGRGRGQQRASGTDDCPRQGAQQSRVPAADLRLGAAGPTNCAPAGGQAYSSSETEEL